MKNRHNFLLSDRHENLLIALSKKIGVNMTDVVQRSLEALEEKEFKRDRKIDNGGDK